MLWYEYAMRLWRQVNNNTAMALIATQQQKCSIPMIELKQASMCLSLMWFFFSVLNFHVGCKMQKIKKQNHWYNRNSNKRKSFIPIVEIKQANVFLSLRWLFFEFLRTLIAYHHFMQAVNLLNVVCRSLKSQNNIVIIISRHLAEVDALEVSFAFVWVCTCVCIRQLFSWQGKVLNEIKG